VTALQVGFGSSVITPPLPTALAGYGDRVGPADDVRDDLEAHAVVFDDGTHRVCLLTLDLLATTPEVGRPVRAAVAHALGVEPTAVVTSCTHTHAGPGTVVGAEALGWTRPDGYLEALGDLAADAARRALDHLGPATIRFGRVTLPDGIAENRRGYPLQPSAAVVDVHHASTGERLGTVINVGLHPTVAGPANLHVATDWVGPFRRTLEAFSGAPAVFVQGAQGDVNPAVTSWDSGDPEVWGPVVDDVGAAIAVAVAEHLDATEPTTGPVAEPTWRTIEVPVGDTVLGALAGGAATRLIEVVSFQVGGITVVAVPGEAFHAAEQQMRELVGDRTLIAGLAPDWHGYFPMPFAEGYEEQLSFGAEATDHVLRALTPN
jgi:hypothetical protein